ncbi:MAG: selenocysteine-specific translation elongation factor [Actinobacteria bacterium]|nr:selenocysteine-specific translation elongation factor [Actinomycetota bacterium]
MQVIGTAGHVDHGKSTLVQRLTGMDPDRFAEEKRRGLTIDLGFAWFALPSGNEVGVVDVPGHERFVRNMLAGAGGVTVCLFVVAANEGWKPQSTEHLAIIDVLGVSSGVVVLTKSDLVDHPTLAHVEVDVRARLSESLLANAPIVACSAATGAGIPELVETLDSIVNTTPAPVDSDRPRLWVDRVFTISGAGTVVTGTSTGGTFAVGDAVELAPEGRSARIRAIQSHKKQVDSIGPGNRVALNLAGLERRGAKRGDAVVRPGSWVPARLIDVELHVIPHLRTGEDLIIGDKGSPLLYAGSAEMPMKLKLLGADRVRSGESAFAQLRLQDPLPLTRDDRFVLRDAGRVLTIGGGRVLDPMATPTSKRDPLRLDLLAALASDDAAALDAYVATIGLLRSDGVEAQLNLDPTGFDIPRIGPWLVTHERLDELLEGMRHELSAYHETHRLERGMAREALRARLAIEPEVLEGLLERADDVEQDDGYVRLSSHRVGLSDEERAQRDEIIGILRRARFEPPPTRELGTDAALLRALSDEGAIVRIGDFYLAADVADAAKKLVAGLIRSVGPATVAQIRDRLGTSRKYAVPLCEWLDAIGVTHRRGDVRILGPHAPD